MAKIEYKENCCSFCDPNTDGYWFKEMGKDDVENNEYSGFTISTEGSNFNLVYEDEYTAELKINFCPVCGRSLKVVYKVNDLEKDFEDNDKENG